MRPADMGASAYNCTAPRAIPNMAYALRSQPSTSASMYVAHGASRLVRSRWMSVEPVWEKGMMVDQSGSGRERGKVARDVIRGDRKWYDRLAL